MAKLPFRGRIFFKVLLVVLALLAGSLWLMYRINGELTGADKVMGPISAIILAYLVHLWLLPGDAFPSDDDEVVEASDQAGGSDDGDAADAADVRP
jgi:hypothetical protein